MATAQSKLDILINAKNNASPAVKQVTGDLAGMDKAAGGLARGLGGLAMGAGIAAGIVAIGTAAGSAAMEMARLSAYSQDVETAMGSLASQGGGSAAAMLEGIREASRGAISDYDLMLTANRAMLLGVAQSTEQMVQLMDVARARSQALGVSTAEAFGDIVTGIGRMSPLILDNLGIVVDQAQANEVYAASIGKAVAALTEQEKKQALVNAVIKDSAQLVAQNVAAGDDAASNFERMDAAIANAKDALGQLFQPAMVVVARAIADAAQAAADGMTQMAENAKNVPMVELGSQMAYLSGEIEFQRTQLHDLAAAGLEGSEMYRAVQAEIARLTTELNQARAAHDSLIPSIQLVQQDFEFLSMSAEEARAAIAAAGDESAATGSKLANMSLDARLAAEALDAVVSASLNIDSQIGNAAKAAGVLFAGEQGGAAGLARQSALTQELKTQVGLWETQGYTQQQINEVLLPGMVSQIQDADRAVFRTATGTAKISDEAREAQQAFEDLRGSVEGVLRGALDPGVGVDPDAVLESLGIPRADAINENARRLADIAANGLKGQDWLGAFQNEVPDIWEMIRLAANPQEEAAHLLRDFQDGLLTSAIDRDKAKEIVRRQILGDRNMAQMAQEIASELAAEMGVPLQQALSAAQGALGAGGGGGGAGSEAAQSFADGADLGMQETDGGGRMVDTFVAQMRASYSKLATAGRDAGKQWGDGFLAVVGESVPPQLISLLSTLVTPQVMAQFAQRGTLTGAAN